MPCERRWLMLCAGCCPVHAVSEGQAAGCQLTIDVLLAHAGSNIITSQILAA